MVTPCRVERAVRNRKVIKGGERESVIISRNE